jgi:predicted transcriptional regulator
MSIPSHTLFKKRGFREVILILGSFPAHEAAQTQFFNQIKTAGTYYNAYLRIKPQLLAAQLIAFKLNDQNDKVIYLTTKGNQVLAKLQELDTILVT